MRNWLKTLSLAACLLICLPVCAEGTYGAQIREAGWVPHGEDFDIWARIRYRLSPSAKEALQKGIALHWLVLVDVREVGLLWDSTVQHQELPYRLQFHALLNQYKVMTPAGEGEMFLTLNAALEYLSNLRDAEPVPGRLIQPNRRYQLAMKCLFEREALPVPLRPFAYLDAEWYLSSDWYLWPIQK